MGMIMKFKIVETLSNMVNIDYVRLGSQYVIMTSLKVNSFNVDVCLKSSFNTWSIIQERSELLFQGFLEEQDLAVTRVLHQTFDEIGTLI
jgi:hypothetical protein